MTKQNYRNKPMVRDAKSLLSAINSGMISRNGGRSMIKITQQWLSSLSIRWNKSLVQQLIEFYRKVAHLQTLSGTAFVVHYLKASSVLLQQSVGKQIISSTRPLKAAVGRTRNGIPRIIPSRSRSMILKGNRLYIRIWLTMLSLYRILAFPGILKTKSITDKGKMLPGEFIVDWGRFIREHFWAAIARRVHSPLAKASYERTKRGKPPLVTSYASSNFLIRTFVIAKSSPTVPKDSGLVSTSRAALGRAALSWLERAPNWKGSSQSGTSLQEAMKQWLSLTNNSPFWDLITKIGQSKYATSAPSLGKLGLKEEAAGKVRVFAMVDAFTQWALKPLHDAIMELLRSLPGDGTFDQTKPVLDLLKDKSVKGLWSFDLSSATDRLPIILQKVVLQPVLGLHLSEAWGDLLIKRPYKLKGADMYYSVGQPMGALSSWAMLALTHHSLVQYAHWIACERTGLRYNWFTKYAVLGDDLIIGDQQTALCYLELMDRAGVEISFAKSLISPNRKVGEFAKRFFVGNKDLSPVPFTEFLEAKFNLDSMLTFISKYKLKLRSITSVLGLGFRSKAQGSLLYKQYTSKRLRNLLLSATIPGKSSLSYSDLRLWWSSSGFYRFEKIPWSAIEGIIIEAILYKVLDKWGTVVKKLNLTTRRYSSIDDPVFLDNRLVHLTEWSEDKGFGRQFKDFDRLLHKIMNSPHDLSFEEILEVWDEVIRLQAVRSVEQRQNEVLIRKGLPRLLTVRNDFDKKLSKYL
uniref:RNA-dependent RNA polymerase n=1 Tax=Grapevine-associated mitovirus 18 TaxID=2814310 RepID=A0A8F5RBZ3_9VIRU|nr:MAG: RNA-dependent RNA polymerase [Grapevine-associated mitovirus 18]